MYYDRKKYTLFFCIFAACVKKYSHAKIKKRNNKNKTIYFYTNFLPLIIYCVFNAIYNCRNVGNQHIKHFY